MSAQQSSAKVNLRTGKGCCCLKASWKQICSQGSDLKKKTYQSRIVLNKQNKVIFKKIFSYLEHPFNLNGKLFRSELISIIRPRGPPPIIKKS